VAIVSREALCLLQLWFLYSLCALGFLEIIFSLSEFGFSRSDLVGISHSDYLFSGSVESFFSLVWNPSFPGLFVLR
jgi:hypothetical protein